MSVLKMETKIEASKSLLTSQDSKAKGDKVGRTSLESFRNLFTSSHGSTTNFEKLESDPEFQMYMLLHYGSTDDILNPWKAFFGDFNFNYVDKICQMCTKYTRPTSYNGKCKALDLGCAVGGTTFRLARDFDLVAGIDSNPLFISTCKKLKKDGGLKYKVKDEGEISRFLDASIGNEIDRTRTEFVLANVEKMTAEQTGTYECVLCSNLIDRIANPVQFLHKISTFLKPGGILVHSDSYDFKSKLSQKTQWVGGYMDRDGTTLRSADNMRAILADKFDFVDEEDVAIVMRPSNRQFELHVSHVTVWKRNSVVDAAAPKKWGASLRSNRKDGGGGSKTSGLASNTTVESDATGKEPAK